MSEIKHIQEPFPGFYYAIFIMTNYYEQLPEYDPNHEYKTVRTETWFVQSLFDKYDNAIQFVLEHYPNANLISPWHYCYEESNGIQITSMADIYIQHCVIDSNHND